MPCVPDIALELTGPPHDSFDFGSDESTNEHTTSRANQDYCALPQINASQQASSWLSGFPTPDDSPTSLGEHSHIPTSIIALVASGSTINSTGTPQSRSTYLGRSWIPDGLGPPYPDYDYPAAQPHDFYTSPTADSSSSYFLPSYSYPPSYGQQVPTDDLPHIPAEDFWGSGYAQSAMTPPDQFNQPQPSMSEFPSGGARSGACAQVLYSYPSPPSDGQSEYLLQSPSSEGRIIPYTLASPPTQGLETRQREHRSRVQRGNQRERISHLETGPSTRTSPRPVEDPAAAHPVVLHNSRFQPYARAPSRRMGQPAHTEESQAGLSRASRRRERALPQNHSAMRNLYAVDYDPMMRASSNSSSLLECSSYSPPRSRRFNASPSTSAQQISITSPTTHRHAPPSALYPDQPQAGSSRLSPPRLRTRAQAQAAPQSRTAELEAPAQPVASLSKRKRVDHDEADKPEGSAQVVQQPRRNVRPKKRARADSEGENDYPLSSEGRPAKRPTTKRPTSKRPTSKRPTTKRPPTKRGKGKAQAHDDDIEEDKPSFPCKCGKTFGRPQDQKRHYHTVPEHFQDCLTDGIAPLKQYVCPHSSCNKLLGTRWDAVLRHMREVPHTNVDEEDDGTGSEGECDEE